MSSDLSVIFMDWVKWSVTKESNGDTNNTDYHDITEISQEENVLLLPYSLSVDQMCLNLKTSSSYSVFSKE